jgi:hypothetical protein
MMETTTQQEDELIISGYLHEGPTSDTIHFTLFFLRFEIKFVVTIPPEGARRAPVHLKFTLAKGNRR